MFSMKINFIYNPNSNNRKKKDTKIGEQSIKILGLVLENYIFKKYTVVLRIQKYSL